MACRKQCPSMPGFEPVVVLNRIQVGHARRLVNLAGTMARRMRTPMASLRWKLAKRRAPGKDNLSDPESAFKEGAIALAGF